MSISEVYITGTSSFLPNEPIDNESIELYMGLINDQASKSKRIILARNGIKTRHYALNEDGSPTHSNASLTALAIRNLFTDKPSAVKGVELLSCGTSSADQLIPSHGAMVHGELREMNNVEVVTNSGACCSGMHALKYAFMSVKLGMASSAIAAGSERMSRPLRSDHFELEAKKLKSLEQDPIIAFEKDFLRWMLSDGAGAFLLQNKKNEDALSLRIEWIEGISYANEIETCMYMAGDKQADGSIKSYLDYSPAEIMDQSILSIKQDVKLLGDNIVKLGFRKLKEMMIEKEVDHKEIAYFLPHMSSHYFEDKIYAALAENEMEITKDHWFTNLSYKGNVGAGSAYLMVDELYHSGKLKLGDKILVAVPESARFSYMFCLLTVC